MIRRGRRRRFGFRRRRRGPETYTFAGCRFTHNVFVNTPCSDPSAFSFQILGPEQITGASDPGTALALVDVKSHTLEGLKFQAEWSLNPAEIEEPTDPPPDPDINQTNFLLTIWEAVVLLPLARGSKTLPAYLPQYNKASDSFDLADRVLWKRLSFLPFWGLGQTAGFPQIECTMRDTAAGPQVVKSKCRVDDKHALFFCYNFVHNLFIADPGNPPGNIPVYLDWWSKAFYRTSLGK